jgi:phosphatidylinositol alpha-1,6-mannosyltransferase
MARAHGWLPFPRRPYFTFVHGIESWPGSAHPKQVRAIAAADFLVCITEYTRERAAAMNSQFARAKPCWLATEQDEPPPPTPKTGAPRVLILSRIDRSHYKGHTELIAAWPAVVSAVPDAVLTIVGSGPGVDHHRDQAAKLGLSPKQVEFRGFVPDAELESIWANTTVFAMPSRGEGFGLVYIEAMRYGIPVIASIHDAGQEVNREGETGYNVNLDTPDELKERLIDLLRNPDRAAALGAAGRARWHQHFRYSCFKERFTPLLHQFLES